MNKGLFIWGFLLVLTAVFVCYLTLNPHTQAGTFLNFTAGEGDWVEVSGADSYQISASGVGYFRISSGNTYVDGQPITGDNFSGKGSLDGNRWTVQDGFGTDYNIVSENPVSITIHQSASDWFLCIIFVSIFGILLFGFGYMIANYP
ncbi:MAG: hypothetical protein UX12_C0012G0003 [Candidatus Collierbacteria bacterium GW2011_GWC1_45_47]|uniref:Uncharacterized protein n=5 Tax=Candidatus Collieribacteriota TaxID=1752725 RepID=A0A0G1HFF6_9BACT|nr:MAG: hypothetical protein UW23_C0003G0030 [Candidatus Collierbacteria bacterium GW2011_GWA1_44_12]KKT39471.1 MAG: hypothetical protein UW26_C0002G0061 [Candidatus Collierbacteria bacterium GW2011_GWF1_44_12]KKT46071.1 MAG: hypothetical protein UW35_C0023G0003 [Candidatus Collierbacteria bacterium GW2011_GWF2_44_15]KKT99624.1 MAG: hypothetical protein UW99_C0005G0008 [Candidatus Collierbacteria bacterium GW2011_GWC2_45_15]KKU09446.1 MAG: hypothetical protein UX12_C0012G0003 [Candidatus Collie